MGALKKWMIIRFTQYQITTLPKWMFSQKHLFKSSLLLNDWCSIQGHPPNNSDDLCLRFCLHASSVMYSSWGMIGWFTSSWRGRRSRPGRTPSSWREMRFSRWPASNQLPDTHSGRTRGGPSTHCPKNNQNIGKINQDCHGWSRCYTLSKK